MTLKLEICSVICSLLLGRSNLSLAKPSSRLKIPSTSAKEAFLRIKLGGIGTNKKKTILRGGEKYGLILLFYNRFVLKRMIYDI